MYKYLLCWRYLRTRYIALASVISVTLGVATMIVVNAVMSGFSNEMENRLHGILSDVSFDSMSFSGVPDAAWHKEQICGVAGDSIEGMSETVVVPAMLNFQFRGRWITRPVKLIGIDETTIGDVGDFAQYLQHPENRQQLDFQLRQGGYASDDEASRTELDDAGWPHRRKVAWQQAARGEKPEMETAPYSVPNSAPLPPPGQLRQPGSMAGRPPTGIPTGAAPRRDPFQREVVEQFDASRQQHTGLVLGIGLSSIRTESGEKLLLVPGDDVQITLPTVGQPPKGVSDTFTIVDLYESKMSEYDDSFVFVPIRKLQELRGMIDPTSGQAMFNSIRIKLKDGQNGEAVRDRLRKAFSPHMYGVYTWRDRQAPLLAAVEMETAILNVLLFLIIAVAGFGILAIFFMIVVEKTRDIGILKSLGARGAGVMGIFLTYGLSLGIVGSGVGLGLGLLIVKNINGIAEVLGTIRGKAVFDPAIYYFHSIPTIVDPRTVAAIVVGAVAIAVLASVLPAVRAARLNPVEALRYE